MKTKKRIITLLLAVIIVLTVSLPIFAYTLLDMTETFSRGEYRYYGSYKQERCNITVTLKVCQGTFRFRAGWRSPNNTTTCYGSWVLGYQGQTKIATSGWLDCPHSYIPTY